MLIKILAELYLFLFWIFLAKIIFLQIHIIKQLQQFLKKLQRIL